MAKNEHVSIKQRVRKSPIESSWFTNVAKSMGFATTDLVKTLLTDAKTSLNNQKFKVVLTPVVDA